MNEEGELDCRLSCADVTSCKAFLNVSTSAKGPKEMLTELLKGTGAASIFAQPSSLTTPLHRIFSPVSGNEGLSTPWGHIS